jgi:5-methylcytosine-specific restriction endonuclease McrA
MESEVSHVLRFVSDDELLRRLGELVSQSRRVEVDLVAHIGAVDERRLFARFAFPSMFAYCTQALHLSDAEAYRRITVARAARRFPVLLEMLREGRLHLSGAAMLAPVLTTENRHRLLARAVHRSKRQLEELVAELSPRPDVPSSIRRRPAKNPTTEGERAPVLGENGAADELVPERVGPVRESISASAPASTTTLAAPAVVQILSPGRYKVQFTASADLREKFERLAALMRSEVPNGDVGALIERAVTEKLERLEARRFAKPAKPRQATIQGDRTAPSEEKPSETTSSEARGSRSASTPRGLRYVPAAVRRAVYERDGERCRYVDEHGRRCGQRTGLEFHHRHPFGMGGRHAPENISLLCRAHNRYLAELDYGHAKVQRRLVHDG